MSKLRELLSIEKDINILEKHGYYKSAEVLHDKFIKVASGPVAKNTPSQNAVDPTATPQQNEQFDYLKELIDNMKSQNRLQRIQNISETLSFNNQLTQIQKETLKAYAEEMLESANTQVTQPSLETNTLTNIPTAPKKVDLAQDTRPTETIDYGNGNYITKTTNPNYSQDIVSFNDGVQTLYKNAPPERQLVEYQTSPGNSSQQVLPKAMDPRMVYPAYAQSQRMKAWENSIPGYSEFLKYKPQPSQIREFVENGGISTEEGQKIFTELESNYVPLTPVEPVNTQLNNNLRDTSGYTVKDSSGSPITTASFRKKFIKVAQEASPISPSSSSPAPVATPSSPNQAPPSQADGSISSENLNKFEKSLFPDTPTGLWSKLLLAAVQQNISLSQALDNYAGSGGQFNGKPLSTHVNYQKLKQQLSSIQPSKELTRYNRQYGFLILNALTDYVLDDQLLSYLSPPQGYAFPPDMAGKPLNLNIYERTGLFRSSYPQERVFIFQKIRQLDPNSGFTGNGYLPRIR